MPDYGARYTDKEISRVERELHGIYQQAKEELEDKLDEFYQKHKARDRMKRKQLADGKITRQEYQDWMNGQIFQKEQWKRQIKQINHVLYDTNSQAVKVVNERRLDVFAENYNYFAYLGEQNPGISFELYDARSVARLIREHPQILPEWKIDEEKDYIWNAKKVNNIVTQGIIQGEGIGEIAQRLNRDLSSQNENKMLMFARTAMTGAQNAGRQQCMQDTANMGVDTHKKWVATLDRRTRDSHRHLDGQEVPYNEDFESDHGAIRYPGDPEADIAEVANCRCTMVTIFPQYEDRSKRDWREDEVIDGQTYAEWKKGKKTQQFGEEHLKQEMPHTMTESEYEAWQKENSTSKELKKQFEEKYKAEIEKAEADTFKDFYVDSEEKWLSEIKDEWLDPIYKVSYGYGRCGYIQAADGSKAINAYLRRGEIGIYSVEKMKPTIDAMDYLIEKTTLDRQMLVDRCAGIDALERLGINCGEHGKTYRIGHAFCTDGVDLQAVVNRINDEYIGSTIIDKGFMSASVVPEKNVFGGSDVTFTVIAPKGTHAFISDNTRESEIVFRQGTEQTITGARVIKREAVDYEGNKKEREVIEVFVEIAN